MSSVRFPLQHYKYSSFIQKKSEASLSQFFEFSDCSKSCLSRADTIKVSGHTVQICGKKLWFQPGSKTVVIREPNQIGRRVSGQIALNLRNSIKELQDHAAILNVAKHSYWDRFSSFFERSNSLHSTVMPDAAAMISKPFAEEIRKHSFRAIIAIFVLLKGLDFSKPLANFFLTVPRLTAALNVIGYCSAAFQLLEGTLSLLFGGIELYQGIEQYQVAKKVHDVNGMILARQRIVFGMIYLAEGCLWITLAALFIAFPHLGVVYCVASLVFNVAKYVFTGVFLADSSTSLAMAVTILQTINKYRTKLEIGILKNERLSVSEKQIAARRFIERLMQVTEEERVRISEKCHGLPSKIAKRLDEKLAKKRMIAQRIGFEEDLLKEKDSAILLERVQKAFKKNMFFSMFSKYVSIVFLIANLAGIPISQINIK